jgi:hypothetical protein
MTSKNRIPTYLLFLILFSSVLSVECKKRLFDYRNKYIGTWNFTYTVIACNNSPSPCDTSKSESVGKISYDRHSNKHVLDIEITPGSHHLYGVNKNGIFTDCAASGKFTDSNTMSFVWTTRMECGGGHSAGSYTVTGTKQ